VNEYRKTIPLSTETQYWFVEMGPIPGVPEWHSPRVLHSARDYRISYPFPTEVAAHRFANAATAEHPGRSVKVIYPEGGV